MNSRFKGCSYTRGPVSVVIFLRRRRFSCPCPGGSPRAPTAILGRIDRSKCITALIRRIASDPRQELYPGRQPRGSHEACMAVEEPRAQEGAMQRQILEPQSWWWTKKRNPGSRIESNIASPQQHGAERRDTDPAPKWKEGKPVGLVSTWGSEPHCWKTPGWNGRGPLFCRYRFRLPVRPIQGRSAAALMSCC